MQCSRAYYAVNLCYGLSYNNPSNNETANSSASGCFSSNNYRIFFSFFFFGPKSLKFANFVTPGQFYSSGFPHNW